MLIEINFLLLIRSSDHKATFRIQCITYESERNIYFCVGKTQTSKLTFIMAQHTAV